jgi:hypothetical protein
VRADLAHHYPGYSLGDLFTGRLSPDECWDFIWHLPRTSATMAALYEDPAFPVSDEAREPRLTEYSPEAEALGVVADRLAALITVVIRVAGGTAPKISPYPRPGDARRAALKEQRHEQAAREWADLCRQLGVPG